MLTAAFSEQRKKSATLPFLIDRQRSRTPSEGTVATQQLNATYPSRIRGDILARNTRKIQLHKERDHMEKLVKCAGFGCLNQLTFQATYCTDQSSTKEGTQKESRRAHPRGRAPCALHF